MTKKNYTDSELHRMDDEYAERESRQRYLMSINLKLESAGINLNDLIELIEARQNREY